MKKHTLTLDDLISKLKKLKSDGFAKGDEPVLISATVYYDPFSLRIEAEGEAKEACVCEPEKHGKHIRIWGV